MAEPKRPKTVPENAVWVEADQEWELGVRDAANVKHGAFVWWRADGTRVCESCYEHGKAQGKFVRYHDDGTPSMEGAFVNDVLHGTVVTQRSKRPTREADLPMLQSGFLRATISTKVWRYELTYDKGILRTARSFTREGAEVSSAGKPLPPRPNNVPADAVYEPHSECWLHGATDGGLLQGEWQAWNRKGKLVACDVYDNGAWLRNRLDDEDDVATVVSSERGSVLFGIDVAAIWLDEFKQRPQLRRVDAAFSAALTVKGYLEVDEGGAIVAAAGVVAQLVDGDSGPLDKKALTSLKRAHTKLSVRRRRSLLDRATAALRVAIEDEERSELAQTQEDADWQTAVTELLTRLRSLAEVD